MFNSGYYVTVELHAKPGRDPVEVREALAELCRQSMNEPGCSIFALHQDAQDPACFVLWERFEDIESFKAHNAEPHTKAFSALALVDPVRAIKSSVVPL